MASRAAHAWRTLKLVMTGSRTLKFESRDAAVIAAILVGVAVIGNRDPDLPQALMAKTRSQRLV